MFNEKYAQSKWLVKSENKILGPYSFEQIEDLIRKKQISIIDEVRDSETRWLYVRENPEFKSIVESIRQELDSKQEATKTVQTISKTEEISKTKTEIPIFLDDPVEKREVPKDVAIVREILEKQRDDINTFYKDESSKRDKVKLYGLQNDEKIKSTVESSTNRFLILVTVGFIGLIISTFGFYFFQKYNQTKQEEQWVQQIKRYKVLSLDDKAVQVFAQINSENKRKVLPHVIEIIPLLETANLVQFKDIESLKEVKDLSLEQKAHLQLVFFWTALQTQNVNSAQDYLAKASAIWPTSPLVRENEALMNLQRGVFKKAYDQFNELFKNESNGRYLMGMALAFSGLSGNDQMTLLPDLVQKIEKYSLIFFDYRKELLLIQIYLAQLENNTALLERSWEKFLKTPLQLSKQFKKPSLLVSGAYLWKSMENIARTVRSKLTEDQILLFDVHNLIESDQISSAAQYLNNNSQKIKDVAVRQQLNMLIYFYQSRRADILALEKANQLSLDSELNHFVIAMTKLEENASSDVSSHISFFESQKLDFYKDWLNLVMTRRSNNLDSLRTFTRNHFQTVNNFIPMLEAKSLVE